MTDSIKKILLEKFRKVLLPDFTNRLTWLLGSGGVALIAGPGFFRLVATIYTDIFGVPIEVEFLSEDRSGMGVGLCLLAVIQNIAYQFKGILSEVVALKDSDKRHEVVMLEAQHAHEVFLKEADSKVGITGAKRKHDVECVKKILSAFPFESSCDELVVAGDLGISYEFQDQLEEICDMNHVVHRFYNKKVESARGNFITQAIETQSVLSTKLANDSRFPNRYVPFYEQKHNGMREAYFVNQKEIQESCYALIRCYRQFVLQLQNEDLWGVDL